MELERLVRYVVGECSREDAADIEQWMAGDPSRSKLVGELRTIWTTADPELSSWDTQTAWATVSRALDPPTRRLHFTKSIWRIAAAVLLIVGVALIYRVGGFAFIPIANQRASIADANVREYVTRQGERVEFRLSDGTRVVLGAASRLRVPTNYSVDDRDVRLDGQAYFEVEHDATRPFVVHTDRGVAKDLGTKFDVRAYPDDSIIQVVVAEGKVALGVKAQSGRMLAAGQLGRMNASGTVMVQQDVDLAFHLAWIEGRLVFANTALRDAIPQLNRWYDLEFRLADPSIAALPLTATFSAQPTPEVLELLALTLGVRHERHGRVVTLYAK